MSTDGATVNVAGFNAIVQAAQRFGVSPAELLGGLHLEETVLEHRDNRVPVRLFLEAYRSAAELAKCEDIGLYVGRINYISGLPLQLYMSTICRSFRQYLNLVPSILKLRGDVGEVQIQREGELMRMEWQPL